MLIGLPWVGGNKSWASQREEKKPDVHRLQLPPLKPFSFETVTLDQTGKIIARRSKQARFFEENLGSGMFLEMVEIPGGSFLMGSSESEKDRRPQEGPVHQVFVRPFFMGKYEVTEVQWKIVARLPKVRRNLDPEPFSTDFAKGDNLPVDCTSWDEAVEFCERLSRHTKRTYRLPTEAEWEYACRAGTTTPFHFGETITLDVANYNGATYASEPKRKAPDHRVLVGSIGFANGFGLYDMHGNISEWCQDQGYFDYRISPKQAEIWKKSRSADRVLRGGSYSANAKSIRSASRWVFDRHQWASGFGLRVIMELPQEIEY